jgi:hypothetical protein
LDIIRKDFQKSLHVAGENLFIFLIRSLCIPPSTFVILKSRWILSMGKRFALGSETTTSTQCSTHIAFSITSTQCSTYVAFSRYVMTQKNVSSNSKGVAQNKSFIYNLSCFYFCLYFYFVSSVKKKRKKLLSRKRPQVMSSLTPDKLV